METRNPFIITVFMLITFVLAALLVLIMLQPVYAEDNNTTTLGYRIAPLQEKLSAITSEDIKKSLNKFTDMGKHWSRPYAGKLTNLQIITGMPDGTFKPDKPLQVDHFIKMTVCAMGYKPGQGKKYWAQPYIDLALQNGIVLKGEFANYTKSITREQMARIIVRVTLLLEVNPDNKYDQYIIGKLKDYESVTDSFKQSVIDAYKLGLLAYSTDGKFRPKATLTRAEGCVVILKFLDKKERKPLTPGPDEVIKNKDSQGNWQEMYPSAVREYFDVAKAMQAAIPKAKGYVAFGFNTKEGRVFASLYESEESYKEDALNIVGGWMISPETSENADNPYTSVYLLTVYNDELYKSLFADYSHDVIKTIFGNDAGKAIALHDKYMNLRNNTLNRIWEEIKLNTRKTGAFRDGVGFSFSASILGKK